MYSDADWESMWAPYDEATYRTVLAHITPSDVVLEIGAGDLRLARRMAAVAREVIAVEIQADLLSRADAVGPLPSNLQAIQADARRIKFPPGITCAVLLMRHCRCFRLYAERLRSAGCHQLLTNARWGMGVELINLNSGRLPFRELFMGWYACWCGAAGFKPGPADRLNADLAITIHEVSSCPACCAQAQA